ncbi:MAG: M67 family metallopeptidase [Candidatus Margulisiibacteriota bacterium]
MIVISEKQKQEIVEHARSAPKHEACGLLAGRNGEVERVYKMTNTSESPETCYSMDPNEQLKVMKEIRKQGLEMVGIFHSHPSSPAYPSEKDVELAFYEDAVYVIVSLKGAEPVFRGFKIVGGKIFEEKIEA